MNTLHITKGAILDKVERLNNSRNGNPRYKFTFDGLGIEGTNQADAGWVYSNDFRRLESMPVVVVFHHTKTGKVVIDGVELIKIQRNGKLLTEDEAIELIKKYN
tara:strand:+ start:72 stop:383 length:312 start_codon:yes stop_codon:yes gene_type:complete